MKIIKKGFTLIELLIVIAIIGILAGIVVISLSGSTEGANDAAKKANLRSAATLYADIFDKKDSNNNSTSSLCKDSPQVQVVFENIDSNTALDTTPTAAVDLYATGISNDILTAASTIGCASVNKKWVIWAELSETQKGWCIDSAGFNGKIDMKGVGTAYAITAASGTAGINNTNLAEAIKAINCASIEKKT